MTVKLEQSGVSEAMIEALAARFWTIHPKEIQDMGISRQEFYAREIKSLLAMTTAAPGQEIVGQLVSALEESHDRLDEAYQGPRDYEWLAAQVLAEKHIIASALEAAKQT